MSGPGPAVRLRYYWLSLLKWVVYICWLHFFTTNSETPCNLTSTTDSLLKLHPCKFLTTDFLLNSLRLIFLHLFLPLECFSWFMTLNEFDFPPNSLSLPALLCDGSFSSSAFLIQVDVFNALVFLLFTHSHGFNYYFNVIKSPVLTSYSCIGPVFLSA